MSARRMACIAAAALLAGCPDKPQTHAAPDAATTVEAPRAFIYDAELPVPADFEEEAAASVDEATYKGDLDALEKEIGASK